MDCTMCTESVSSVARPPRSLPEQVIGTGCYHGRLWSPNKLSDVQRLWLQYCRDNGANGPVQLRSRRGTALLSIKRASSSAPRPVKLWRRSGSHLELLRLSRGWQVSTEPR